MRHENRTDPHRTRPSTGVERFSPPRSRSAFLSAWMTRCAARPSVAQEIAEVTAYANRQAIE